MKKFTDKHYEYAQRLISVGVPVEIAAVAMERVDEVDLGYLHGRAGLDLIISMFTWEGTPEGHGIWSGVNECLVDLVEAK